MTTTFTRRAAASLARRARARLSSGRADDGFILLEMMISLSLITVVMAAVGVQYVNGIVLSAHQRSTTTASQVATSAMSDVRGVDPSALLSGRKKADVQAQRTRLASIPKLDGWLSLDADRLAYNDATGTATVPTTAVTRTVGAESYKVETYLECASAATVSTNSDGTTQQASCGAAATRDTMRAVVVAIWDDAGCPAVGCAFVTSTLIDTHANPTFDLNQPLPDAPIVKQPGDQALSIGDEVSLQLAVENDTGAAPFTWALTSGTLPAGLSLSPSGLVSGTVGGSPTTTPLTTTVRVTDSFLRTASATVKWTVTNRLVLSTVPSQTTDSGKAATAVVLSASGGSGGYVFSDPLNTLPPGLTLNSGNGRITGTPTTPGTYTVRPVVTDSTGKRTATTSFTWTVTTPPLAISCAGCTRTLTRDVAVSGLTATATGGSTPYRYDAGSTLPAGLSLNTSSGAITGTPTAVGTKTVTVEVTDGAQKKERVSFTLAVVAPASASPADQRTTRGGTVSFNINPTCPNGPCTYAFDNAPAGNLAISSTGQVTGSLSGSAQSVGSVSISIRDASNNVTKATFRWTVVDRPTVADPGRQQVAAGLDASIDLDPYASGGTPTADGRYTWILDAGPTWLSIDPQTGVLSGRAPGSASATSTVTVRVRDTSDVTSEPRSFTLASTNLRWTCSQASMSRTVKRGTSLQSIDLSACVTGGNPLVFIIFPYYRFSATGLPANLTVNGDVLNGYRISGTVPTSTAAKAYPVEVTVTDADGNTATTTITITVTT